MGCPSPWGCAVGPKPLPRASVPVKHRSLRPFSFHTTALRRPARTVASAVPTRRRHLFGRHHVNIRSVESHHTNTLVVRNRAVMPSMLTNFATKGGDVTERLIHYYAERAKAASAVSIEGTAVEPWTAFIRGISAADDSKIKGLSKLAKAIKAPGARAALQLIHGGRCVTPAMSGFATPMVSYVPRFCNHAESVVLDVEDIEYIIDAHAQVARRVREAGFDMLEIHGAHGYLISQFVSPLTNHREDAYGGSLENRLRMPLAVIRAIRKAVGDDFPISYRHNADDGLPGGMTLEETLQLVNPLVDAGVDALHISAGIGETKHLISPPSCTPEAWLSDAARQVKEAVRNRVPVISVGRYVHPAIADQVIRDGKADMVAFGRALIAEPELINKYAENRLDSVRVCLGCNEGCTGHTGKLLDITCAINPRAGYEGKYPLGVKADKALKVAVVGADRWTAGGATAAQRGHSDATERGEDIGGLSTRVAAPFKDSLMELVRYFRHELTRLGEYPLRRDRHGPAASGAGVRHDLAGDGFASGDPALRRRTAQHDHGGTHPAGRSSPDIGC
ncbi:MAG: hypothetical protein ACLSHC_16240 [Bilophila wadsworthia]